MPLVRSGRIDLHYEIHGRGRPVVFVHGAGTNSLAWFQQVPELAEFFQCVLVDLRGCKGSRCPDELVDPRYFAEDLLAVLDAAHLQQAALACHGAGAWAGLPLAVKHPRRVACVVLSGANNPVYSPETWEAVEAEAQRPLQTGFGKRFRAARPDLVELYERIARLNGAWDPARLAATELQIHPDELEGYAVPTLLVRGKEDSLASAYGVLKYASLIPGAKTFTFEEVGDSPYYEAPQLYNRVLHSFFRQANWI